MISDRFDPNIPGVGKQAMLDWMHINRPMTSIRKNANKNEVAQKVREAQPELFPDPFSEEPLSLDCQSIASKQPPLQQPSASTNESKLKEKEGVIKIKRSSSPGNQPPNKRRVVSGKSCLSKSALRSKLPEALDQGAIRADGKVKGKSVRYDGSPSPKASGSHKGKDDHQFREASKGAELRPFDSTCSERGTPSGIVKVEDQKPFHTLQKLYTSPQSKPNTTTAPSTNPLESATHITQQASQQEQLVSLTSDDTTLFGQAAPSALTGDLIFFSDLDLFELENIVDGLDIPPIAPNYQSVQITPIASSSIPNNETESNSSNHNAKRSGADVFQDERHRSLQLSMLEARMNSMEKKIDSLHELQARVAIVEEDIQVFRERIACVETDNQKHKKSLKEVTENRMKLLEDNVEELRSVLNKATGDVEAHGKVLLGLLEEDYDEQGSERSIEGVESSLGSL